MGYDMYRRGVDRNTDEGYFRLNIWGMSDAREQLLPLGIVRLAAAPVVPMTSDFGVEDSFDWDDAPEARSPAEKAYVEALRVWREGSDGEGPGIPTYKLGSNDGWVVNIIEVQSGVRHADEHHPGWRTTVHDFVREFIEWAETCTEGFEVW